MVNIDVRGETERVNNFWNAVHFHPTDAIEDEWGQRILDSIADNRAANFVRIYAMLEDIVSRDNKGNLTYDFALNDERIDYLIQKGFDLLICFNFMPDCIAKNPKQDTGIPRYKGKRVNNSPPLDYALWEEVCFKYTEHLRERYGAERLSRWYFHCWNEPDHEYWVTSKSCFDYERDNDTDKIEEYIKLYDAFASGVNRACGEVKIGGPSAAVCDGFMHTFIEHVSENEIKFDFLSIHAYSDIKYSNTDGKICPENILKRVITAQDMLREYNLGHTEIIMDEWGAAAGGFLSIKKNPEMIFRENEYFPAFYFKLIKLIAESGVNMSHMLICLSGQHKSVSDFDGYRSFFTKSGFKKPIYNGYCLSARLGTLWFDCKCDDCIATVNENGDVIIAVYSLENIEKKINISITGLQGSYEVRHTRIDRENANSYTAWLDLGSAEEINEEQKCLIYESGELKTITDGICGADYSKEIVFDSCGVELIELVKKRGIKNE